MCRFDGKLQPVKYTSSLIENFTPGKIIEISQETKESPFKFQKFRPDLVWEDVIKTELSPYILTTTPKFKHGIKNCLGCKKPISGPENICILRFTQHSLHTI